MSGRPRISRDFFTHEGVRFHLEGVSRPLATFSCEADTRTVGYGELTLVMGDLKGFRYVERRLTDPGREFHEPPCRPG